MSQSTHQHQQQNLIHSLVSYNLYGPLIKGWLKPSDSSVQICRKSFVCAQVADVVPSIAWLIYFAAFGNVVVLPSVTSSTSASDAAMRGSSSDFGASTAIIALVSFVACGLVNVAAYSFLRFGSSGDTSSLATAQKLIDKRRKMALANEGGSNIGNTESRKNVPVAVSSAYQRHMPGHQQYSRPRPKPVYDVIFDLLLVVQGFLTFGFGWILGLDLGANLITCRVACIAAVASLGRARYAGALFFVFFALVFCSLGRMGEQPATMPSAQSKWWPYFVAHTVFLMLLHLFIVRDVWHVTQSPAQKLSEQNDQIEAVLNNLAQLPLLLHNATKVTAFDARSRRAVKAVKETLLNSMKEFYKTLPKIDDVALQAELLVLRNTLVLGHSMGISPGDNFGAVMMTMMTMATNGGGTGFGAGHSLLQNFSATKALGANDLSGNIPSLFLSPSALSLLTTRRSSQQSNSASVPRLSVVSLFGGAPSIFGFAAAAAAGGGATTGAGRLRLHSIGSRGERSTRSNLLPGGEFLNGNNNNYGNFLSSGNGLCSQNDDRYPFKNMSSIVHSNTVDSNNSSNRKDAAIGGGDDEGNHEVAAALSVTSTRDNLFGANCCANPTLLSKKPSANFAGSPNAHGLDGERNDGKLDKTSSSNEGGIGSGSAVRRTRAGGANGQTTGAPASVSATESFAGFGASLPHAQQAPSSRSTSPTPAGGSALDATKSNNFINNNNNNPQIRSVTASPRSIQLQLTHHWGSLAGGMQRQPSSVFSSDEASAARGVPNANVRSNNSASFDEASRQQIINANNNNRRQQQQQQQHHHYQQKPIISHQKQVSPEEQREKNLLASSLRRSHRRSCILVLQAIDARKAMSSAESLDVEIKVSEIARDNGGFVHVGSTAVRTVISWNAVTDEPQAEFANSVARCVLAIRNRCRNYFIGAAVTGTMLLPCPRGLAIMTDCWLEQKLQADVLKLAERAAAAGSNNNSVFLVDLATARGVPDFEMDLTDIYTRDLGGKSLLALNDEQEFLQVDRFVPLFSIVRDLTEAEKEEREVMNRVIIEEEADAREARASCSGKLGSGGGGGGAAAGAGGGIGGGEDDDDDFFQDPHRLMQGAQRASVMKHSGIDHNNKAKSKSSSQKRSAAEGDVKNDDDDFYLFSRMYESKTVRAARYVYQHQWSKLAELLQEATIDGNRIHNNMFGGGVENGTLEAEEHVLGVLIGLAEWKLQSLAQR